MLTSAVGTLWPQPPFLFLVFGERERDLPSANCSVLWQWQGWVSRVACSIFRRPWISPFIEYDSPCDSCIVCFGDNGTKPKEWFYTSLLLLHAWDAAGGQWHLIPVWWPVALEGDPVVCLALCLVPHRHCHCSVVNRDNREPLHGLHRALALPAPCRAQERPGPPCGYLETSWLILPCPSYPRCFPDVGCICVPGVLVYVYDLCNWACGSNSRVFFLWVGTIERAALYSGLSTEITLPSPQLTFCPEGFLALELRPFRIIVLFLQTSGCCNQSHICGCWSVNLPASNNLVIFYSGIVHRMYCAL